MLIDYHTHHERCGHATGTLREYVEQAIILNLDEIGLSDHMPVIHLAKDKILPGLAMELKDLERYVQEILDLKEEYKNDIKVKLGIEADYIEGYEEKIKELLSPYPFDYIIGSVHFLGEWDLSDSRQMKKWQERSVDEIYIYYYKALQGAARSGLYDIIGHFDVVKKHGHLPVNDVMPIVFETLMDVKNNNVALEINTSGLMRIHADTYPSFNIIEKAIELKIPFTLGSDAHKPEDVHKNIDVGREFLLKNGVREIATFTQRDRVMVELNFL